MFFLINIVLLLLILFLLVILSMVWPPDSPWAPWWQVDRRKARAMCKLARVTKKDIVYDLGSGDGISLIVAAKEFGATGVGIEVDPLRAFLSKIRMKKEGVSKDITIKRNNFFKEDLSEATVVFAYLVPKALQRLLPKLKKELQKDTRIICVNYKTDLSLVKEDKKYRLFLYSIV